MTYFSVKQFLYLCLLEESHKQKCEKKNRLGSTFEIPPSSYIKYGDIFTKLANSFVLLYYTYSYASNNVYFDSIKSIAITNLSQTQYNSKTDYCNNLYNL